MNDVQRGRRADALLADDLLKQAFSEVRANIVRAWETSKAIETDTREILYHKLHALDSVKAQLEEWVRTGEFEDKG